MIYKLSDIEKKYGPIVGSQWPQEVMWCESIVVPEPFCWNVVNTLAKRPWIRSYVNKDAKAPLLQALAYLVERKLWNELKTFDGCYNVRKERGRPLLQSAHSWAMAFDFNAEQNPLGGPSQFSDEFVKCFTDAGFYWGGDFQRPDPQHFTLLGF